MLGITKCLYEDNLCVNEHFRCCWKYNTLCWWMHHFKFFCLSSNDRFEFNISHKYQCCQWGRNLSRGGRKIEETPSLHCDSVSEERYRYTCSYPDSCFRSSQYLSSFQVCKNSISQNEMLESCGYSGSLDLNVKTNYTYSRFIWFIPKCDTRSTKT